MHRIHYFLIIFLLAFTYSCGDETSVDKLNDIKSDASNFEDGVSTAMEYNDGVISEISLLDLKMMALNEQVENGIDDTYSKVYEEFIKEYERVSGVIYRVAPAGKGGTDFKASALDYIDSYGEIIDYFAPENITEMMEIMNGDATPSDEQSSYIADFMSALEDVDSKFEALAEAQQVFANKNDSYIKKEEVDLEEIYEETK